MWKLKDLLLLFSFEFIIGHDLIFIHSQTYVKLYCKGDYIENNATHICNKHRIMHLLQGGMWKLKCLLLFSFEFIISRDLIFIHSKTCVNLYCEGD
jgi:hypothetical protein